MSTTYYGDITVSTLKTYRTHVQLLSEERLRLNMTKESAGDVFCSRWALKAPDALMDGLYVVNVRALKRKMSRTQTKITHAFAGIGG